MDCHNSECESDKTADREQAGIIQAGELAQRADAEGGDAVPDLVEGNHAPDIVAAWRGNSAPAKLMLNGRKAEQANPTAANPAMPLAAPPARATIWKATARRMGNAK